MNTQKMDTISDRLARWIDTLKTDEKEYFTECMADVFLYSLSSLPETEKKENIERILGKLAEVITEMKSGKILIVSALKNKGMINIRWTPEEVLEEVR